MVYEIKCRCQRDVKWSMKLNVDVKEIESRFEYRNEFHASSRFTIFYVWEYGWCM